jgi:hypothetical protein
MSYLYGDSTKFPYDVDYIELSRHAVDCAMQLLSAQHAIASTLSREEHENQLRERELSHLSSMGKAVEAALVPFLSTDSELTSRAAVRAMECAQSSLVDTRADGERRAAEAASHAQHVIQRAGESAHRTLEAFLVRHDVPETQLGLSLGCSGESYGGEVSIRSPFGVNASFVLRIGADHTWSRPRRVGDLSPGIEVHVPQPSGWISRRVEMALIKLDRMFLSAIRVAGSEIELSLRKSANAGSGYRLSIDLSGERGVLLTPLDENGGTDSDPPLVLDGEDGSRILELSHRVLEAVQGLTTLRGNMSSVALDGQPLNELEWPEIIAHRLLGQLAPTVLEIARRSGAPGEWVLRRDVGGGRREEIYVTTAELWERLLVLPPERREAFGALGLTQPAALPLPIEAAALATPVSLPSLPLYDIAVQAAIVSVGPPA